jgi:hypothetical protein
MATIFFEFFKSVNLKNNCSKFGKLAKNGKKKEP